MRPAWLEMVNIGPFVKKTRVDLESIEEGGLFLISGPTGSGKSFIFDSICYALYGKTPSGRDKNLRSDHAPIGDDPIIRFCFQVGDVRYLVERTLETPRLSGGATNRPEAASLVRLIPDGAGGYGKEVVASKKSDVKVEVTRILGLEMEQFSRVMMIPQGEFRELLRADTDKREVLLRQLFDSILYKDITDSIDGRSRELYNRIKKEEIQKETVVTTIVEKLSLESGPGNGVMFSEWSGEVVKQLGDEFEVVSELEREKKEVSEKMQAGAEKARNIFRISSDLDKARKRKLELENIEKEDILDVRRALDLNEKGQRMRSDLETLDRYSVDKQDLEKEIATLKVEHERAKAGFETEKRRSEDEAPAKRKELESLNTRKSRMKFIFPKVEEMGLQGKELKEKSLMLDGKMKERSAIQVERQRLKATLEKVKKELGELPEREDVVKLTEVHKAGTDLLKILGDMEGIRKDLEGSRDIEGELKERFEGSEKTLDDLRRRREGSLAGELAKGLETGKECPVCGSLDHPFPRQTMDEDASLEDVEKASLLLQRAQGELGKVKFKMNTLQTSEYNLLERQREIGSIYPELSRKEPEKIKEAVMGLQKRLELTGQRERKERELHESRDRLDHGVSSLTDSELGEEVKNLSVEVERLRSTLKERESHVKGLEIDLKAGDPVTILKAEISAVGKKEEILVKDLEEMSKGLEDLRKVLITAEEKLRSRNENMKVTTQRLEKTMSSLDGKLNGANLEGLGSIDELREALLEEKEETDLKQRVEVFSREQIQVRSTVETLEKNLGEQVDEVPTEEELRRIQDEEAGAKRLLQEVIEKRATAESDLKWTKQQLDKVQKASRGIEELEKTMKVVGRLTMQVKGLSNPRMSLERFFLAQRFEEVLISSNQRLKVLSGGRFLLRRADEAEMGKRAKRAKEGLDLNVYDNYTGQERPANTLSGGQMFLSSLALALGLADVVQSRSGGIRMDALFIDEGFGSLDDETLQTALKVLSELREGRMVGVISHVGELKRQIRSGFEVVPSPTGSVVRRI